MRTLSILALAIPLFTSASQILLVVLAIWALVAHHRSWRHAARLTEALDEARALRAIGEAIPGAYYTVCPPDASGRHAVSVSWGGVLRDMGIRRGEAVGTFIEDWVRETEHGMTPYLRAFEIGHYRWDETLVAPNGRAFRLD